MCIVGCGALACLIHYRQQEASYLERIKEVEKTKQEEALHLQERASNAIKDLEERMKELKRGITVLQFS